MADHEREIKLLAGTPESLEKLARIPDLAGFRFGPTTMREQEDLYVDTEDYRLFAAGQSVRYRRREGRLKATLKEVPGAEHRELLRGRREISEVLDREGDAPSGPVGDALASIAGERELRPILRLRTRRRLRPILAGGSTVAELCLDEVEVSRGPDAEPAGRFLEVEVEEIDKESPVLGAMGEQLLARPDLEPSLLSKFERGLDLLGLLGPAREAARRAS